MSNLQPLILTLKIDSESFRFFDALRREYFPPQRNFLSAHVTLFHHLPGENLSEIVADVEKICRERMIFPIHFTNWRFLGKGAAINIKAPLLIMLREKLAKIWRDYLTPQDRQKFQPHITVQNKVSPDEARQTYEFLSMNWKPRQGRAEGLTIWHYAGGPWKFESEFLFEKEVNPADFRSKA